MFGKNNLDCYLSGLQFTDCDGKSKLSHEDESFPLRHSSACDLRLRIKDEERLEEGKSLNNGKLWSFESGTLGGELQSKRRPHSHHNSPVGDRMTVERKSGSADSIPREVENSDFIAKHRSIARLSRSLLGICDRSRTLKKSPHRAKSPIDLKSLRRKSKESLHALLGNLRLSERRSSEIDFQVSISKRAKDPLHVLLKDLKLTDHKAAEFGASHPKINPQTNKTEVPCGLLRLEL